MARNHGNPRSHLTPEQRMDRNGRLSTRWVRGDKGNASSAALHTHTVVPSDPVSVPTNVNWNSLSRSAATKIVIDTGSKVKLAKPETLWQTFDFYTGMLESVHSSTALAFIKDDEVAHHLKTAWLSKHDYPSSSSYKGIDGDFGWDAYEAASKHLTDAARAAADSSGDPYLQMLADDLAVFHNSTVAAANDGYDPSNVMHVVEAPEPQAVETPLEPSFIERLKEAKEEGYPLEPFREELDEVADITSAAFEGIRSRHSSDAEIPAEVGGSTFEWSDFNPFKRRKK